MLLDIFDPKAQPKAIGIDLGTTNSIVAVTRDQRPQALINCDGSALLPSVVHYGKRGEVIVGRNAKAFAQREPAQTISSAKRFMGRGADDPQTKLLGAYNFEPAGTAAEQRVVRFNVGSRVVTPVEVSAEILRSLKQSAQEQLQKVGGAVITVPAYFDDAQRQATRDAGKLAGLEVLRLINEPTAAALAYGLETAKNGTFAVYDLGGGTFDVTVLHLEDGVFQVKSTGGDSALGGDDMDRLIAGAMLRRMGFDDPHDQPVELASLVLEAAREAKHALSEREQVLVELPARGSGDVKTIEYVLTRAQFEALILPLLERTGRACRRALRDAELEAEQIDGVILVGGATRVPRVKTYVAELFGRNPLSEIDPDLVVAYGAAIHAEMIATASDEVLLLDVLPLSLGVETMGGGVDKILPRNTSIPCEARSTFTTYADKQTGFEIHVVQGERELARDCRSLARFTLKGIPALPAGMARLELTFHVDQNSLLEVRARELTTGIEQLVEVKPSYGLDDETVEQMLFDALEHGEADLENRRLADLRVEASRIQAATEKALLQDADLLTAEEKPEVVKGLDELVAASNGTDASAIQRAIDVLDQLTHAWAGRRMDRAIVAAISGKKLGEVEAQVAHAAGIEAHLEPFSRQGEGVE